MNYRQWKKNYKKRYGRNPSWLVDKRKRSKLVGKTVNAFNSAFSTIIEGVWNLAKSICKVLSEVNMTNVEFDLDEDHYTVFQSSYQNKVLIFKNGASWGATVLDKMVSEEELEDVARRYIEECEK